MVHSEAGTRVTHLGDPLDPDVLTLAGVATAQAVILTLEDDRETAFAASVLRGVAPEAVLDRRGRAR